MLDPILIVRAAQDELFERMLSLLDSQSAESQTVRGIQILNRILMHLDYRERIN